MEMGHKTLKDHLISENNKSSNKKRIKFEFERDILLQVTLGLSHLHKLNIVHGNMKLKNILILEPNNIILANHWLLGSKPVVKLSDFGLHKLLKRTNNNRRSIVTNLAQNYWMAPEVLTLLSHRGFDNITIFDYKSDVWALGCIFTYTLSGGKHILEENLIDLKSYSPNDGTFELIKSMLERNPSLRPTVDDILKSSIFVSPSSIIGPASSSWNNNGYLKKFDKIFLICVRLYLDACALVVLFYICKHLHTIVIVVIVSLIFLRIILPDFI